MPLLRIFISFFNDKKTMLIYVEKFNTRLNCLREKLKITMISAR
jgi:hypothetical protein